MTETLVDADDGIMHAEHSGRVRLAQERNARALFNANLAKELGVPYAASLARLPTLDLLIASGKLRLRELYAYSRAARALDEAFGSPFREVPNAEPDALQLPFFASTILQNVSRPAEIPESLSSIRDRSAGLREHLREVNAHLYLGDDLARRAIADMHAAFGKPAVWEKIPEYTEVGAAAGHSILLISGPMQSALTVIVALLYGLLATTTSLKLLRSTRPQYRILHAGTVANSAPAATKIWSVKDPDGWISRIREF